MAEAGPGPSSMASSPVVPGTAKQLRIKKRVINLVNPADPGEFSSQSMSPNSSLGEHNPSPTQVPPTPTVELQSYTPMGFNRDGVRGILRPSGTPGSGNGVRFFPKNRFRIITPNQSVVTPIPQPPSPTNNSFLSQLLAVTIPSMSPRKPAPIPEEPSIVHDANESWEVPGQEGEISLIASSMASERSQAISEADLEEQEAEPWTGNPEIHSSPLGLPSEPSVDVSGQDIELPSAVMQVPEDMSNLLSQRFSTSDIDSFSIAELPRPQLRLPPTTSALPTIPQSPALTISSPAQYDDSMQSSRSVGMNDSNPTIRRQLSPLPRSSTKAPETPTPGTAKPFTSIFADMSAEQADLSWPLTRRASPTKSDTEDDTAFHSAVFANLSAPGLVDMPINTQTALTTTPNSGTPGNATEFFDCRSPTPSPSVPSLTSSGDSIISRTPSPFGSVGILAKPTTALFEAHSAHTSALISELDLYRSLAGKLQFEVSERDGALANLNLRVIEGEVWRVKVEDLQQELKSMKSEKQITSRFARESSSSPSPIPREHPGDRTTAAEASSRDLQIRLAKALSDQEMLTTQLNEIQESKAHQAEELHDALAAVRRLEERERDAIVQAQRNGEDLRNQLEVVIRRERALHSQLKEAKSEVEAHETEANTATARADELENKVRRLKEVKDADEQEIGKLAEMLDRLKATRSEDKSLRLELEEAKRDLAETQRELQDTHDNLDQQAGLREEAEEELTSAKEEISTLTADNDELERHLQEMKTELLARLNTPSKDLTPEITRLRSESASKDLEILNLQRRKSELKEDLEMLNIALDSKQQELELIKRKFAVKGVAGCTPLASSRKVNTNTATPSDIETPAPGKYRSTVNTRRESSLAMVTPSLGSEGVNGRMMKSAQMLDRRTGGSLKGRTSLAMGRVEEENRPPVDSGSVRSMRRERVLA